MKLLQQQISELAVNHHSLSSWKLQIKIIPGVCVFCFFCTGLQQAMEHCRERIHSLEETKGLLEERLSKLSNDVKLLQQQISELEHEVCKFNIYSG